MIRLQEGKFYRTRDGRKVKVRQSAHRKWPFIGGVGSEGGNTYFEADGTAPHLPHFDLIAEWTDGPVRTVTRREVVPGNYGIVMVYKVGDSIRTEFNRSDAGPNELRAAAAVLLELAGALDE